MKITLPEIPLAELDAKINSLFIGIISPEAMARQVKGATHRRVASRVGKMA
jgi:hypothetical protein